MKFISKFKIYPVIEMSPWRFGDDVEMAKDESFESFALRIYRHYGIAGIDKLDSCSKQSIPISKITNDSDLSIIIAKELGDAEIAENGLDYVDSFEGGIVIDFANGSAIVHSCCGSISDYKNWLSLIEQKPENWEEIWIGHPWLYGRVRNGKVQLSDFCDEARPKPEDDDSGIKYIFDLHALEQQLLLVQEQLKGFKNRIKKILKAESYPFYEKLAEIMIEGELSK